MAFTSSSSPMVNMKDWMTQYNASTSSTGAPIAAQPQPRLTAPTLTPYQYNTESTSYPTYLRNLGENTAQKGFQRATNRISMGNSFQQLQHAQDELNNNRLGYMSQAGQQELAVQNALAAQQDELNKLLTQLYGYDVAQRGQDLDYAGQLANAQAKASESSRSSGGGGASLGGGNSQGGGGGTYKALGSTPAPAGSYTRYSLGFI